MEFQCLRKVEHDMESQFVLWAEVEQVKSSSDEIQENMAAWIIVSIFEKSQFLILLYQHKANCLTKEFQCLRKKWNNIWKANLFTEQR